MGEAIETPKSLINMTNAHFGSDASVTDFSGRGAVLSWTSISSKIFRHLNFGTASFNFRFFGINKNYLLIIKKFITRYNYNYRLLNH